MSKSISTTKRLYKVVFIGKGKVFNFECEVQAKSEAQAKIAGRSELMAENYSPNDFKSPVISVSRNLQGVA